MSLLPYIAILIMYCNSALLCLGFQPLRVCFPNHTTMSRPQPPRSAKTLRIQEEYYRSSQTCVMVMDRLTPEGEPAGNNEYTFPRNSRDFPDYHDPYNDFYSNSGSSPHSPLSDADNDEILEPQNRQGVPSSPSDHDARSSSPRAIPNHFNTIYFDYADPTMSEDEQGVTPSDNSITQTVTFISMPAQDPGGSAADTDPSQSQPMSNVNAE